MRKSWGGLIWVLFICGLLLGGAPQALAKEKEVVIGYIGPLTGGAAFLGVDALNGCLLAAEEINAAGGITVAGQKYKLKIETYDDEATPAKAVAGLKKLKDLYDIGVVIDNVSGSAMAITETNERMGVLWSGFARFPGITARGNKLVLRMEASITVDTDLAAQGAIEIAKAKTFAVLSDTGDWGRGVHDNFVKAMEARGAKHLATEWFDMRKDTDFRVQITKVKAMNPDTIKVVAYDEASGQIVKQCREMGVTIPLVLTTGFQSKGEQIAGAKNIEGCINVLMPGNFDPVPKALVNYRANYQKKYKGEPAVYGELDYELIYIIARGMEKAGNINDAYKIKAGMKSVVPIEKEHRTAWLKGWTDNGDGILWRDIAIYKNGRRVLKDGRPASPQE
jgi:branched-chain amino acid transport system substrate-binding protein